MVGSTTLKTKANILVTGVQLDPFPSLVARYNFDETNGRSVADASGNGHDGTTKGSLAWEPSGHQNGALTFSGTSGNYVDLGRSEDLQPSKITLSYWIKRTASMGSNENILLWFKPENDYAANGFFVTYNGDVSSLVMVDGTGNFFVKSAPDDFLPLNEWTNVVFTFDSETKAAAIYKNGIAQEIDMDGDLNSITAASDVKKIGVSGYGNGAQLNATLDDFRIYNGAMTAKQVKAIYDGKDVQSVQPVAISTSIGKAPALPDTVAVIYENASQGTVDVSWDAIDPSQYAQSGTFQVYGKVDGTSIKAVSNVTVTSPIPATRAVLTPSQPDGRNGWYVHPVTVNLIADNQSGIKTEYNLNGMGTWQTYTGPVTMNQDGKYNLSYRSSDNAGNVEVAKTVSFNLDVVAPTISISGLVGNSNLGDAGDILPMFLLNDGMSGVDSSRTTVTLDTYSFQIGTTIPLYTLPLGTHTFNVVSSDLAGNTASVTVTFQTSTSIDALKALITRFTKNNWIDNAGIANSLQKKLDKGNVESFVSEVQAQAGKHVSSEAATYLLRDAQALINKK
nr:LamG-like jellyroll fold domain-containing protein [Paenibacillus andongensis]